MGIIPYKYVHGSRITIRRTAGGPLATLPPTSAKVFLHPVTLYQGGRAMVIDSDDAAAISVSAETRALIAAARPLDNQL